MQLRRILHAVTVTVRAVRAEQCICVSCRFILGATEFDNFYVAPMCSQTRAALLTGRDFPRTGTMLINGGGHSSQQQQQQHN
jgi:hypothetical protein